MPNCYKYLSINWGLRFVATQIHIPQRLNEPKSYCSKGLYIILVRYVLRGANQIGEATGPTSISTSTPFTYILKFLWNPLLV